MSEYGEGDDNLDDTTASANNSANNSIIGKMRTGVSNILPQSFSKWFSPSSNKTDSANGQKRRHLETDANTPPLGRRRIEVNDYPEDEDDEADDLDDEDEGAYNVQPRRSLNASPNYEPPPMKRSRVTFDGSMLNTRPLVASTPAVSMQRNAMLDNHHTSLNPTHGRNKREPAYNFFAAPTGATSLEQQNATPDIIDLIPIPMSSGSRESETKNNQLTTVEPARSRRDLNILPRVTSSTHSSGGNILPSLKRQSLCSVKENLNTSTKQATENNNSLNFDQQNATISLDPALELDEAVLQAQAYNGQMQSSIQNGNDNFECELRQRSSPPTDSEAEETDTLTNLPTKRKRLAAGSLKAVVDDDTNHQRAKVTGLFNMSTTTTNTSRNGSRTSSFGNGLNFDTHLQGRKSLFSGLNALNRTNVNNKLTSSTLSLNSLSRRQFNASIYGSTSALSDSRLLNTSSPFYKGNTTYGGAAAYSKYTKPFIGGGTVISTTTRLTPTIIRPTSSLSTLSSSNNSIAYLPATSKTLLDTINELTTPIGEAKKMGGNNLTRQNAYNNRLNEIDIQAARAIRLQQVTKPYARPTVMLRPKDKQQKEIAATTPPPPIRELQVPTMSHLLAMKRHNQNLTMRSRQITMQIANSQNYAIKSIEENKQQTPTAAAAAVNQPIKTKTNEQNIDDKIKKIANSELNAPIEDIKQKQQQQQQQKHINKIRHKINSTRNVPDLFESETSLLPADLPKIIFPAMKEMPKIDISLTNLASSNTTTPTLNTTTTISKKTEEGFKFSTPARLNEAPLTTTTTSIAPATINFKFCEPEALNNATNNRLSTNLLQFGTTTTTTEAAKPKSKIQRVDDITPPITLSKPLKAGSCLDALKKKPMDDVGPTTKQNVVASFGEQFKKTANEWDCDACMLRNKETAEKCVACETPRKQATQLKKTATNLSSTTTMGFGNLYKKQAGEWECDACMLRNKQEATKCISCETARKTTHEEEKPATTTTNQSLTNLAFKTPDMGFQAIVKAQKSATWQCESCLASNDAARLKCVCCDQAKSAGEEIVSKIDTGFKEIVSKQAEKWECEACMTHNESTRLKCVCCEEAKPGSTTPQDSTAPKFSFGTTAATKFNFGFGAAAASNENELRGATNSITSSTALTATTFNFAKTETTTKGFTFGLQNNATTTITSTSTSSGFTFGFPATSSSTTSNDVADNSKPRGFTFGLENKTTTTSAEAQQTTTTSTISELNKATTTAAITSTAATTPLIFTGFGSSSPKVVITSTSTTTSNTLTFGFGNQKTTETSSSSKSAIITTTAVTTANSTFNYGSKATTPTTTTTVPSFTLESANKPIITFGGATPIQTSTSSAVPSTTIETTTTTATATVTATSSKPASFGSGSGFQFGNSAIKPIFGTTTPTTTVTTFGAFTAPKLGNSQNENLTTNMTNTTTPTITSSTTPAPFGGFNFGAKTESNNNNNLFGSLASKTQTTSNVQQAKPIASATPMFGGNTAANASSTSTSMWPKSTPLFGTTNDNAPKLAFGNIGNNTSTAAAAITSTASASSSSTSIFGSNLGTTSAFGSNTAAPVAAFGANSTTPIPSLSTGGTSNLFGSNNNNNTVGLPQFGNVNNNTTTAAPPPAFGNSSASATFGGFGATPQSNINSNTQSNTATPFQFGGAQNTNSGGFNFGASAASKPAFNFTATNPQQPSFNFTGGSTETNQNTARPFQFGAPAQQTAAPQAPLFNNNPSSMVFSFGGTQTTSETNTPFQFNAGNTSNIFAPQPTASNTAQSSAAARRRVRVPTRRFNQR